MGKCDFDVTHRKTGPTDVWARDSIAAAENEKS